VILVTVGTHEQPFDRLLREVDRLAASGSLASGVFCQTGYSSYEPAVPFARMLPFEEMQHRIEQANAVVTHGGPGSILPALSAGKPLVLVPRQQRFGEHVDDHQLAFCRRLSRERDVPLVEDIGDLRAAIRRGLNRGDVPAQAHPTGTPGVAALAHRIAGLTASARPS
jgi:UDP-N-acetylglucosamine transferase subunit ALG13